MAFLQFLVESDYFSLGDECKLGVERAGKPCLDLLGGSIDLNIGIFLPPVNQPKPPLVSDVDLLRDLPHQVRPARSKHRAHLYSFLKIKLKYLI